MANGGAPRRGAPEVAEVAHEGSLVNCQGCGGARCRQRLGDHEQLPGLLANPTLLPTTMGLSRRTRRAATVEQALIRSGSPRPAKVIQSQGRIGVAETDEFARTGVVHF